MVIADRDLSVASETFLLLMASATSRKEITVPVVSAIPFVLEKSSMLTGITSRVEIGLHSGKEFGGEGDLSTYCAQLSFISLKSLKLMAMAIESQVIRLGGSNPK